MFQRFMIDRDLYKLRHYRNCLLKSDGRRFEPPFTCKKDVDIQNYCPSYFTMTDDKLSACYDHFHGTPNSKFAKSKTFKLLDMCLETSRTRLSECRSYITQSCLDSKVRSFKTIRLTMELVDDLFSLDPSIKIMYLVRDPRGIVNSRSSINETSIQANSSIAKEAQALCDRMSRDFEEYERLIEKYPGSIYFIRYEDIAESPLERAQDIYSFVRSSGLSESVEDFLRRNVNSHDDGKNFGTHRQNSKKTAYKWREKLSADRIESIKEHCKEIIEKLGYEL